VAEPGMKVFVAYVLESEDLSLKEWESMPEMSSKDERNM
jgi:hypothetical protein